MITTAGKSHILRRNAGIVNTIADTIALGVSSTSESLTDTKLAQEFLRLPVNSVYPDVDNGTVIFKTTVPAEISGKIYEVGLIASSAVDIENAYDKLITSFTPTDSWSTGTFVSSGSRAGGTMLRLTSNSSTIVNYDLSYYVNEDLFNLAVSSSGSTTVVLRLGNNSSNYFEKSMSLSSGYQFVTANKGSFSVTGNPSWNSIQYFAINVNGATVDFDSLRVQKKNIVDPTYVLVSRKVMSSPWDKVAGSERELEYSLKIV